MSQQFALKIPKPNFNRRFRWSSKAYAVLAFRDYQSAVKFRRRFVGANYDAAYIGVREIKRINYAVSGGFTPPKNLDPKKAFVVYIRIEHGGTKDLARAVGFIECQLFDAEDQREVPVAFEVWNC
jgi:hypothetical protein